MVKRSRNNLAFRNKKLNNLKHIEIKNHCINFPLPERKCCVNSPEVLKKPEEKSPSSSLLLHIPVNGMIWFSLFQQPNSWWSANRSDMWMIFKRLELCCGLNRSVSKLKPQKFPFDDTPELFISCGAKVDLGLFWKLIVEKYLTEQNDFHGSWQSETTEIENINRSLI